MPLSVARGVAAKALDELKTENDDQKTGINIVRKALSWPARLIAINAGEDGPSQRISGRRRCMPAYGRSETS